jgi:hypothetical protein
VPSDIRWRQHWDPKGAFGEGFPGLIVPTFARLFTNPEARWGALEGPISGGLDSSSRYCTKYSNASSGVPEGIEYLISRLVKFIP